MTELTQLREENEQLKNKLYHDKRNVFAELNDDTAHSNEMLLLELADAKEIIEGYLKITKSWNYNFSDILDWNKKARAFLKE